MAPAADGAAAARREVRRPSENRPHGWTRAGRCCWRAGCVGGPWACTRHTNFNSGVTHSHQQSRHANMCTQIFDFKGLGLGARVGVTHLPGPATTGGGSEGLPAPGTSLPDPSPTGCSSLTLEASEPGMAAEAAAPSGLVSGAAVHRRSARPLEMKPAGTPASYEVMLLLCYGRYINNYINKFCKVFYMGN